MGRLREFFYPHGSTIAVSVVLCAFALYTMSVAVWDVPKVPLILLFLPLFAVMILPGAAFLIIPLGLLYCYALSCAMVQGTRWITEKRRVYVIVPIVLAVLLLGIDEPLVNGTVNRMDTSCQVDADCRVVQTSYSMCGSFTCANTDWEHYDGLIAEALALSCPYRAIVCSCEQNTCVTQQYRPQEIEDNPTLCELPGNEEHKRLCSSEA